MATTFTVEPRLIGVALLVRARHAASWTRTVPSGEMSSIATPWAPTIQSRPIVGVPKRVRVIDGMPTMYVNAAPPMPTSRVIHDGRSEVPSTSRKRNNEPNVWRTRPTAVQKRGTPT